MKTDATEWLLEPNNPSVRYFTLVDLLEQPRTSSEVTEAKNQIMETGVVPKIMSKQTEQGYWDAFDRFYTAKYKGTVWQLIILAELGADGNDERIKTACEFIFDNSQDLESGGFSVWPSKKLGGGRHSGVIPCLTGNMVWSLIKLGFYDDPRLQRAINWIVQYQRFDDGESAVPKGWPYDKLTACFSKHSCHMGVVKSLKGLAAVPSEKRSDAINDTIKQGVEYLLIHSVHKKSHDLNLVSKPGWLRFGFPLMYQTDVVEILNILTSLGYKDERMQEAVDVVVSKQDESGRWLLDSTFNGRFQTNIEQKGKPSKWVTLKALTALKHFYS